MPAPGTRFVSAGSQPAELAATVTDLRKTFNEGRVVALDGVSFQVARGELLVLIGLSGSGKSTLLRHFNGLEKPDSGHVEVLGERPADLRRRELRSLRRRIGFVFQQFYLAGRLTALENVLSGALGRIVGPRYGILSYPDSMRREALEQLDRVGLVDKAFQRADTLSGGEQQRTAIARTLFQQPEIVLADEPVASLDPESSESVMRTLISCCEEDGITVVCSLHQVELALGWAQRMIGLRDGQVVLDREARGLSDEEVRAVYRRVTPEQASPVEDDATPAGARTTGTLRTSAKERV